MLKLGAQALDQNLAQNSSCVTPTGATSSCQLHRYFPAERTRFLRIQALKASHKNTLYFSQYFSADPEQSLQREVNLQPLHLQMLLSINGEDLSAPFSLHAGEQPGSRTQPLLLRSCGKRAVPAEHGHSLISFIKVFPSEMLLKLLPKPQLGNELYWTRYSLFNLWLDCTCRNVFPCSIR